MANCIDIERIITALKEVAQSTPSQANKINRIIDDLTEIEYEDY